MGSLISYVPKIFRKTIVSFLAPDIFTYDMRVSAGKK